MADAIVVPTANLPWFQERLNWARALIAKAKDAIVSFASQITLTIKAALAKIPVIATTIGAGAVMVTKSGFRAAVTSASWVLEKVAAGAGRVFSFAHRAVGWVGNLVAKAAGWIHPILGNGVRKVTGWIQTGIEKTAHYVVSAPLAPAYALRNLLTDEKASRHARWAIGGLTGATVANVASQGAITAAAPALGTVLAGGIPMLLGFGAIIVLSAIRAWFRPSSPVQTEHTVDITINSDTVRVVGDPEAVEAIKADTRSTGVDQAVYEANLETLAVAKVDSTPTSQMVIAHLTERGVKPTGPKGKYSRGQIEQASAELIKAQAELMASVAS